VCAGLPDYHLRRTLDADLHGALSWGYRLATYFFRSRPIRPSLGYDPRILSLAESAAQLDQRDVLQLPNTFPRNAEIFTHRSTPPLLRISGIFPCRCRDDGRSLFRDINGEAKRMTNHGYCSYSDSRSVGMLFQETRL
jgi:hypothetical protein